MLLSVPGAAQGGFREQGERTQSHLTEEEQKLSVPTGWEEAPPEPIRAPQRQRVVQQS